MPVAPTSSPCRRSNIELQRLDAVSRSPIYAHFSESLSGVETIRAYRMVQHFSLSRWGRLSFSRACHVVPLPWACCCMLATAGNLFKRFLAPPRWPTASVSRPSAPRTPDTGRCLPRPAPRCSDSKVDANHRAYFTARMANEWLSMRLDCIGACVVLGTALLAIIRRGSLPASLAALTMSEALDVTMFLKAAVTSGATFESRFNAGGCARPWWMAAGPGIPAAAGRAARGGSEVGRASGSRTLLRGSTSPICCQLPADRLPVGVMLPAQQWSGWCTTGACPRRRPPSSPRRSRSPSGRRGA